jgi:hypothetical protein
VIVHAQLCIRKSYFQSKLSPRRPPYTSVTTLTSGRDRIGELLPFRAKLLVVVLASGRNEEILCMVTYAVHELLDVSFRRDRVHHEGVVRSVLG